ncbi:hypothetical protein EVAR_59257_1 [Eumeta japonica]|uniref:Uncharacterized protein n=1 Tax=Eumeta variegata TaxID=151549 RepID=A0A4C1YMJ6_EUMVA|nr:hypothetical protein EVAR_59257_1 [Eumeta japonica]
MGRRRRVIALCIPRGGHLGIGNHVQIQLRLNPLAGCREREKCTGVCLEPSGLEPSRRLVDGLLEAKSDLSKISTAQSALVLLLTFLTRAFTSRWRTRARDLCSGVGNAFARHRAAFLALISLRTSAGRPRRYEFTGIFLLTLLDHCPDVFSKSSYGCVNVVVGYYLIRNNVKIRGANFLKRRRHMLSMYDFIVSIGCPSSVKESNLSRMGSALCLKTVQKGSSRSVEYQVSSKFCKSKSQGRTDFAFYTTTVSLNVWPYYDDTVQSMRFQFLVSIKLNFGHDRRRQAASLTLISRGEAALRGSPRNEGRPLYEPEDILHFVVRCETIMRRLQLWHQVLLETPDLHPFHSFVQHRELTYELVRFQTGIGSPLWQPTFRPRESIPAHSLSLGTNPDLGR